jgi:hypothetical protein
MAKKITRGKAVKKDTSKKTPKDVSSTQPARAAARPGIVAPAGAQPEFVATEAGCLDRATSENLVFSCTGFGQVDVDTKLGDLFPAPVVRRGFCGCVLVKAKAAGVDVDSVPCNADSTIEDVIESLSC